jgi:hypothetical protein
MGSLFGSSSEAESMDSPRRSSAGEGYSVQPQGNAEMGGGDPAQGDVPARDNAGVQDNTVHQPNMDDAAEAEPSSNLNKAQEPDLTVTINALQRYFEGMSDDINRLQGKRFRLNETHIRLRMIQDSGDAAKILGREAIGLSTTTAIMRSKITDMTKELQQLVDKQQAFADARNLLMQAAGMDPDWMTILPVPRLRLFPVPRNEKPVNPRPSQAVNHGSNSHEDKADRPLTKAEKKRKAQERMAHARAAKKNRKSVE